MIVVISSVAAINAPQVQPMYVEANALVGTYKFVSESTVLTKPEHTSTRRAAPDWAGIWQIQSGYYTRVLMRRRRDNFFQAKTRENWGFESFAGPYDILDSNEILLHQAFALNPLEVDGAARMKYKIAGDTLTLVQDLKPRVEDLREGTITTVLKRIK
jgi:hypothetical protein